MSSQLYLDDGSSSVGLRELQNNDTIKYFASMPEDTYRLVKATNPTLLMVTDLAKKIMSEGDVE